MIISTAPMISSMNMSELQPGARFSVFPLIQKLSTYTASISARIRNSAPADSPM